MDPILRFPNGIMIEYLQDNNVKAAAHTLALVWTTGNVITSALKITYDQYIVYAERLCSARSNNGLSLVAVHESNRTKVIGFQIQEDLYDPPVATDNLPPEFNVHFAFTKEIESTFVQLAILSGITRKGIVLHENLGGVLPEWRAQGLIDILGLTSRYLASKKGYLFSFGTTTHEKTVTKIMRVVNQSVPNAFAGQEILRRASYRPSNISRTQFEQEDTKGIPQFYLLNEIKYKVFKYKDRNPLAEIYVPDKAVLYWSTLPLWNEEFFHRVIRHSARL